MLWGLVTLHADVLLCFERGGSMLVFLLLDSVRLTHKAHSGYPAHQASKLASSLPSSLNSRSGCRNQGSRFSSCSVSMRTQAVQHAAHQVSAGACVQARAVQLRCCAQTW